MFSITELLERVVPRESFDVFTRVSLLFYFCHVSCFNEALFVLLFRVNEAVYNIVLPQKVSERKSVGNDIIKPSYWKTGVPDQTPSEIEIKTEQQIIAMQKTCAIARSILKSLEVFIKVIRTFTYFHNCDIYF